MYFSVCVYMLCKQIYECINKLKITCKIIYKYVFDDYDDDNDDDDEDDDYDDKMMMIMMMMMMTIRHDDPRVGTGQ